MSIFGFGKKSDKEIARENDRAMRKVTRDLERERHHLDVEEKKLIAEIKEAHKQGNAELARAQAKNLHQLRQARTRTIQAKSKVQSVSTSSKLMQANAKVTDVLGTATKTMGEMNKATNPADLNKTLQEFSKQNMKMQMTDEMINDTLDDIMAGSDDEEATDKIVDQVLDEIGIEISGKMADAPTASGKVGASSKSTASSKLPDDDDLEAQFARLRS